LYLKYSDKLQESAGNAKTRENVCINSQSNLDNLNNVRRDASRHFKNKKKAYLKAKVRNHFSKYRPTTCWRQSFIFLYVWTLRAPSVFISNWNGDTLYQRTFMPVKPFATAPGPLQGCDGPWSHVSMCALMQAQDILSICC